MEIQNTFCTYLYLRIQIQPSKLRFFHEKNQQKKKKKKEKVFFCCCLNFSRGHKIVSYKPDVFCSFHALLDVYTQVVLVA